MRGKYGLLSMLPLGLIVLAWLTLGMAPWVFFLPLSLAPLALFLPEIIATLTLIQLLLIWIIWRRRIALFVFGWNGRWVPWVLEGGAVALVILLMPFFVDFAARDAKRLQGLASSYFGHESDTSYWRQPRDLEAEYRLNHILHHMNQGEFERARDSLVAHVSARPDIATGYRNWTAPGHRLRESQLHLAIERRQQFTAYLTQQARQAGLDGGAIEPRLLKIAYFLEYLSPGNETTQEILALYEKPWRQVDHILADCRYENRRATIDAIYSGPLKAFHLSAFSYLPQDCVRLGSLINSEWRARFERQISVQDVQDVVKLNKSRVSFGYWTSRSLDNHPYAAIGHGALSELWQEWTGPMNITRRLCPKGGGYQINDLGISYYLCGWYLGAIE